MMESLRDHKEETKESVHLTLDYHDRSRFTLGVAVICALALTVAILFSYLFLRRRHREESYLRQQAVAASATPVPSPEVQVYVDDAMLKGGQTILGGTLQNISRKPLSDLSVDIELRRRKDQSTEIRSLPVEPRNLDPNQQGRYSVALQSNDYSGAKILHVKGGGGSVDIAFNSAPGARRPPERTPQPTPIIVKPPSRSSDGGFINTPDNPARIP